MSFVRGRRRAPTHLLVTLMDGEMMGNTKKGNRRAFTVSPAGGAGHAGAGAPDPALDAVDDGRRPSILVVEDNPDTSILMEQVLEDLGEVKLASNAEDALEVAERTDCTLVVMDINLGPGINGADVMQMLRMRPNYAKAPFLALTAYALPGDRERFLNMGFTAYLSKPFQVEELLETCAQLLKKKGQAGDEVSR